MAVGVMAGLKQRQQAAGATPIYWQLTNPIPSPNNTVLIVFNVVI